MPSITLVQNRIANTSVGPSTVRGQPKNTVATARKYLAGINLQEFTSLRSELDFRKLLDDHTLKLSEKLPWGFARKVINIFLFEAVHNILIDRQYELQKISTWLEVPLDNPNAKKLKRYARTHRIYLEWTNIQSLKPEVNAKFQVIAKSCAQTEYQDERCYLDLHWWRPIEK
ncbi:MAG: hypothetical protein V1837_06695 [Candidatus Woesearchaeota archaeon]